MLQTAVLKRIKPYLRGGVLLVTLGFLAHAGWQSWAQVSALQVHRSGWAALGLAWVVTFLAHLWAGWVWSWIVQAFNLEVSGRWSSTVYLRTNLAKYLPGNVWHFYGRVQALEQCGASAAIAAPAVLLEPVLMAAAALIWALVMQPGWGWPPLALVALLLALQPRWLNPLLQRLGRTKGGLQQPAGLRRYPLRPLLGEVGFVLLRAAGFGLVVQALLPLDSAQLPSLMAGFSLAWLAGLVVPGAPGGLGVFEATAVSLLQRHLPVAVVLGAVALYRLIGLTAEVVGAALVSLPKGSSRGPADE
jgi:glycosyltransferase 2 family protein